MSAPSSWSGTLDEANPLKMGLVVLNFYERIHQVMTDDVLIQSLIQKLVELFFLSKFKLSSHKERAFEMQGIFLSALECLPRNLGKMKRLWLAHVF